ncbi:hypothetical protein [Paraburkholderia dinghuensis]|uniref:hypothetical protein n=1 Tax=Paraburkholderia dinghuensis TaxID=2305225 RepID=UPI00162905EE|nr:hypothetical protein [Paraburkholderia dinghuensis]
MQRDDFRFIDAAPEDGLDHLIGHVIAFAHKNPEVPMPVDRSREALAFPGQEDGDA